MDSIDNVTVTIFVRPESFAILIEILKKLEDYDYYEFNPLDIVYSEGMISNFIWLNVPVDLYTKFKNSYNRQKSKNGD